MTESILLVLALSLDAFVASIAYGTNKIKIPFISVAIINIACSSVLAFSLFLGSIVKKIIPVNITSVFSFLILLVLGVFYLFQSLIKAYITKPSNQNKEVQLKMSDLIINIYVDETSADFDNSKDLNPKEAIYLAIALSLDSLAVGFGSSLGNINYIQVILFSLFWGMMAIWLGVFIGKKFAEKLNINISWLSGVLLMILAIKNLI
ncbi:sporulation membrane protein YtaF [Alkaliphilus sp. MSJ-5]|uniref:Sporulation membrane protein YtaF n=1 Tax=Alkaliphilus flagellatus TaxID=2841507 RepID=A0ABS6FYS9_9FIRM|nr:sporulation membrane protein YtaF [Alkaliphilus flagellatus]MBU5675402.1 sporulation membrane protein YtaF [Alkaliphilus flagellatus]